MCLFSRRGAKHFLDTFRIVFPIFSRFSNRSSYWVKTNSGAVSFCRRATLTAQVSWKLKWFGFPHAQEFPHALNLRKFKWVGLPLHPDPWKFKWFRFPYAQDPWKFKCFGFPHMQNPMLNIQGKLNSFLVWKFKLFGLLYAHNPCKFKWFLGSKKAQKSRNFKWFGLACAHHILLHLAHVLAPTCRNSGIISQNNPKTYLETARALRVRPEKVFPRICLPKFWAKFVWTFWGEFLLKPFVLWIGGPNRSENSWVSFRRFFAIQRPQEIRWPGLLKRHFWLLQLSHGSSHWLPNFGFLEWFLGGSCKGLQYRQAS